MEDLRIEEAGLLILSGLQDGEIEPDSLLFLKLQAFLNNF